MFIDIHSGEPWDERRELLLQRIVKWASDATVAKVAEMEEQAQLHRPINPAKGVDAENSQVSQPSSSTESAMHLQEEPSVIRWEHQKCAPSRSPSSAADSVPRAKRSTAASKSVALWQGDITELTVDTIVNPVTAYTSSCGLSAAIHSAAGRQLEMEFEAKGGSQLGKPVMTSGYHLKAKHVVHADGRFLRIDSDLRSCYSTVLDCVAAEGLRSVAFPCLRLGFTATHCALSTVRRWLDKHAGKLDCVVFVTFRDSEHEVYAQLLPRYFPRCDDFSLQEERATEICILFAWSGEAGSVKLTGQVNGWDKSDSSSMTRCPDGIFRKAWWLPRGRPCEYKFIVDGVWRCRMDQPITKDAYGRQNNVIDLTWTTQCIGD
mmetsp:Transcript_14197/g.40637  ORF Transcript_14197/g.40637 Transcript_14197/m.40637 type:complete len:376 (-) Transcript_14197:21-1148(-)